MNELEKAAFARYQGENMIRWCVYRRAIIVLE